MTHACKQCHKVEVEDGWAVCSSCWDHGCWKCGSTLDQKGDGKCTVYGCGIECRRTNKVKRTLLDNVQEELLGAHNNWRPTTMEQMREHGRIFATLRDSFRSSSDMSIAESNAMAESMFEGGKDPVRAYYDEISKRGKAAWKLYQEACEGDATSAERARLYEAAIAAGDTGD